MLIEQLTGQSQSHLTEIKNNIFIHSDVIADFQGLQHAAKTAGFNLQIASGFRSFSRQLAIWNNKYSGNRPVLDNNEQPLDLSTLAEIEKLYAILHWSALPGTSRHHWGTDFDIYDPNLLPDGQALQLTVSEFSTSGYFEELSHWLSGNMTKFGFYRPYHSFLGGVASEPWHISYYPIAQTALKELQLDFIYDLIMAQDILGKSLIYQQLPKIFKQFVCNINPPPMGKKNDRKT